MQAEDCLDQFQLEDAYKFAKQALDMEPNNIKALDVMAAAQVEMGNVESARNISF
jgi:thioredoxin-like negative regulator of GroEL